MGEREYDASFDERFTTLLTAQAELARLGYVFVPIPREHVEGLVTGPVLHRLHTQVKKRGFRNVAGRVLVTFSGYSQDDREVFAIPEARAYWQALDRQLPELPALVAVLPELGFNGPGMQLMLLGEIDAVEAHPDRGGYEVHVADAARLVEDATRRIRQAGRRYHLDEVSVSRLVEQFRWGAGQD